MREMHFPFHYGGHFSVRPVRCLPKEIYIKYRLCGGDCKTDGGIGSFAAHVVSQCGVAQYKDVSRIINEKLWENDL